MKMIRKKMYFKLTNAISKLNQLITKYNGKCEVEKCIKDDNIDSKYNSFKVILQEWWNIWKNIENDELPDGEEIRGGKKSKKTTKKKEIHGVMRCIYKLPDDRKEYVKHKGKLITIKDFKEFMKPKKLTKPKKQTKAKKQTKTK